MLLAQGHLCSICGQLLQGLVCANRSTFKVLVQRDLRIDEQQVFLCEKHTFEVLKGLEVMGLSLRGYMGLQLWAPPGANIRTCSTCLRACVNEEMESLVVEMELLVSENDDEEEVEEIHAEVLTCDRCVEKLGGVDRYCERRDRVMTAFRKNARSTTLIADITSFLAQGDDAAWKPPPLFVPKPKALPKKASAPRRAAPKKKPPKRKSHDARASRSSSRSARGASSSART